MQDPSTQEPFVPGNGHSVDRRTFLRTTAVGIGTVAASSAIAYGEEAAKNAKANEHKEGAGATSKPVDPSKLIWRSKSPDMEYVRLGSTNFMVSRIVAGLGGGAKEADLLRRSLQRGVNYFDTARGYGSSEVEFKPFLKEYGKDLWVVSKATDIAGYSRIDQDVRKLYIEAMKKYLGDAEIAKLEGQAGSHAADKEKSKAQLDLLLLHNAAVAKEKASGEKPDLRPIGKLMAEMYLKKLDESLERMGIDCVDSYFMHGIEIPWFFDCHEVWEAYEKAHKAGKVKHFGFSVHNHHKEVLAAAVGAIKKGPWKIDLIMPGVNPVSFDNLKPELAALKKLDVGIVAMKTNGLKNRKVDGNDKRFETLMANEKYGEYERSKLWMLNMTDGLIDAVICQMQNMEQLEKNIPLASVKLSAQALRELDAIVKLEMAGACHLCGDCQTHCPEHIALVDMLRYHAYVHQYDEKDMARALYEQAGYDPAKLCSNCGTCSDVCKSRVPIVNLLHELSRDMA